MLHHGADEAVDAPAGADGRAAADQRSGDPAFLRAADGLALAAAPSFVLMACVTGLLHSGPMTMPCPAAHDASSLSGMTVMYGLMSVFHAGRWLKLFARRRRSAAGHDPLC